MNSTITEFDATDRADFRAGKEKALNSLVGAVMKKTKGRADARTAREVLPETRKVGLKLYEAVVKLNMIEQLKELRRKIKVIRVDEIEGGFVGIFMALGAEMDRKNGLKNKWDENTGPIAYEESTKIDKLIENIQLICSKVDRDRHYFGMLRQLGFEMAQKHGKFGER